MAKLRDLFFYLKTIKAKIICFFRGHDWGYAVCITPVTLEFCHRGCGKEIQDRTFDDIEPMGNEWEWDEVSDQAVYIGDDHGL